MDEREALERLAAVDHAAYVLERAEAAVAGCDEKVEKIRALLEAAEDGGREARTALAAAEHEHEARLAAADEVPEELRAAVATLRPDIVGAPADVATGGAH